MLVSYGELKRTMHYLTELSRWWFNRLPWLNSCRGIKQGMIKANTVNKQKQTPRVCLCVVSLCLSESLFVWVFWSSKHSRCSFVNRVCLLEYVSTYCLQICIDDSSVLRMLLRTPQMLKIVSKTNSLFWFHKTMVNENRVTRNLWSTIIHLVR